jgi:copper resistance protein B
MSVRAFHRGVFAVSLGLTIVASASAQSSPPAADPHAHSHSDSGAAPPNPQPLPPFIPQLTDEDRKAAFPDVPDHAVHDRRINSFVLFEQIEGLSNGGGTDFAIDSTGWIGLDRDRFWFRAEGDADDGGVDDAHVHLLYGRQISRWWDVVAGVRQDFRPGPAQTWAAVGIQGLAPYWFEVEATGYVGTGGRTHARFEVEYDLLLTNRLIAQPLAEIELFGKSDPERGVGAGLSTTDVGLRVRYEFRREFAPYVGVVWRNKWGRTADFAAAAGEDTGGARFVTGLRLWF